MGCTPSISNIRNNNIINNELINDSNIKSNVIKGLVGLQNLGNTCFMNASIQCLLHTSTLVDYFTSNDWYNQINRSNPLGRNGEIAQAFGELLNNIIRLDSNYKYYSIRRPTVIPSNLRNVIIKYQPLFRGNNQHDAQELLAYLLDGLHEDLNQVINKPNVEDIISDGSKADEEIAQESWIRYQLRNKSIIVDLLQGQLKSTLTCLTCNTKSIKFETFMYLSLPLVTKSDNKKEISIYDCLSEFCKEELLTNDYQWKCSHCKVFRDAKKRIELWSVPDVLIIHLKRFYYNNKGQKYKIDELVDFPTTNLDLTPSVLSSNQSSKQPLFNLYGVSNHIGNLTSGHYTAIVRNRFNNKWYNCNDSNCSEQDESSVCTNGAYVLFYHRIDNNRDKNTTITTNDSDLSIISSSSMKYEEIKSSNDVIVSDDYIDNHAVSSSNDIKKLEEPEKLLDQALNEMKYDLIKILQSYAEISVTQKRMIKQKDEIDKSADVWYKRAGLAVLKNDEELAKEALLKRQIQIDISQKLENQLSTQQKSLDKLYESILLLDRRISDYRRQKTYYVSRSKSAVASMYVTDTLSSLNSFKSFDSELKAAIELEKLKDKVETLEIQLEVAEELAALRAGTTVNLERKFKKLENDDKITEELEKLKIKVSLS